MRPARVLTVSVSFLFERYDPLAQSAEHLPFKQGVRSSNLRWITISNSSPKGDFFTGRGKMPPLHITIQSVFASVPAFYMGRGKRLPGYNNSVGLASVPAFYMGRGKRLPGYNNSVGLASVPAFYMGRGKDASPDTTIQPPCGFHRGNASRRPRNKKAQSPNGGFF